MATEGKAAAITAGGAVRASAPKQPDPKAPESEPANAAPDAAAELDRARAEIEEARRNFQAERELAEEERRAQRDDIAKQRELLERERAELAMARPGPIKAAGAVGISEHFARSDFDHRRFVVARGHALATARGILDAGAEVTLEDFGGSAETFQAHIRKGRVVQS